MSCVHNKNWEALSWSTGTSGSQKLVSGRAQMKHHISPHSKAHTFCHSITALTTFWGKLQNNPMKNCLLIAIWSALQAISNSLNVSSGIHSVKHYFYISLFYIMTSFKYYISKTAKAYEGAPQNGKLFMRLKLPCKSSPCDHGWWQNQPHILWCQ